MNVITFLSQRRKFLIAVLAAVLGVVAQYYGNNPEVATVIAFLGALGVHQARNDG